MNHQSNSEVDQPQGSHFDENIPYVFDCLDGKTIEIASDEPLEDPHRIVQHQTYIDMVVEVNVDSFEDVLED